MDHAVDWKTYLSLPQLNASTLAHCHKSWAQVQWVLKHGYEPKTDTRVGTALHSIVEYLPLDKFYEFYTVMPDYTKDPRNRKTDGSQSYHRTSWVTEMEAEFIASADLDEKTVLSTKQFRSVERMLQAISNNHEAMELITMSMREMTLVDELRGVGCKARVDGYCAPLETQWNLKTTRDISRFSKTVQDLHYLWKDAFHLELLNNKSRLVKRFKYIVVEDVLPNDRTGEFNCAPECVVLNVPIVALENCLNQDRTRYGQKRISVYRALDYFQMLRDKFGVDGTMWPGMPSGELYISDADMGEDFEHVDTSDEECPY